VRVRIIGFLAIALVAFSVRAQTDAERMFRKWADEHVQVLAKDRNATEREKAAEYLGDFEYPDVIAALAESDPDPDVRAEANATLARLGGEASAAATAASPPVAGQRGTARPAKPTLSHCCANAG
jgi:hypothetical protein